jgi:hypothetical protein
VTEAPAVAITVPLRRLDANVVPPVCLKTGEAAQCVIATVASATPRWAWLLVIPGGGPYFAARRWLWARQVVNLPARNLVFERWQLVRRATAGCFAVAVVVLGWSVATLSPVGFLAAAFVGAATTGGWMLLTPTYWVVAELDGEQVRLSGVNVGAARALERG